MKSMLPLTLTASLVASSLPAQAQVRYVPPPQYLPPQAPTPVPSNWARVRALAPGSRISVAAVGLGGQDQQYFVSASERTLTVLLVGGLPRSAKQLAIKLAATHPELFMLPEKWMEFSDGRVRANPDGLFVGGHKVADLGDIAKTIDAGDVFEVSRPSRDRLSQAPQIPPETQAAAASIPLMVLILAKGHRLEAAGTLGVLFGVPLAAALVVRKLRDGRGPQEIVYRAPGA
jgi:hypothetical protein